MMFELSAVLSSVVEAPLWMLVLLKVTALLAVGWVLHFCLRRANPRWRVLLWRGVAIWLIAMPAVTLVMPTIELRVAQPSRAPVERIQDETVSLPRMILPTVPGARPLQRPTAEPVPDVEEKRSSRLWPLARRWLLPELWVVGVAVLAFRLWLGHRRVKRFMNSSHPAPETVINECRRVAEALRCKRDVDVRKVSGLSVPFLTGLRRPVLLLPERMCDAAYTAELSGIIAHEVSHVRSHDLVWGYVLHWLSILLWFHPLLWPVRSAHASACEEVSDAVSAHFVGDANVYSRTLARVAVDLAERPPATAGIPMARMSDVTRRLKALKRRVFSAPLSRRRVIAFVLTGLLTVAILGAVHIAYTQATENEVTAVDIPPEVQELIELLQSEDRRERAAAALSLREMGEDAAPAAPFLVGLLGDETPVVGWTGRVFSLFGVSMGPSEYYNSPAFFAGMALSAIGAPAVEPLIAALNDKGSRVRKNAALKLGMIGDVRAFEPLVAALNDKNAEVRGFAARALGILNDPRAVEPLIGALQDKDDSVGVDAAFALGRIGEPAVEPLIAMLKHRKRFVRQNALMALADTGDARAVEPLIAALEDKDYNVRESAVRRLMEIGEERAVEPLIAALEDKEWRVRTSVVRALVEIAGSRGIDPLIGALKDKDPSVRERAARGLGKLGDGRAIEPLIGALKDEDVCVRTYAAIALADLGDTRAVEPLIAALDISLRSRKRWKGVREFPIKLIEHNLRTDAVQALKRMTGRYLGLDPAKWREWWEENKGTFEDADAEPVESEAPISSE